MFNININRISNAITASIVDGIININIDSDIDNTILGLGIDAYSARFPKGYLKAGFDPENAIDTMEFIRDNTIATDHVNEETRWTIEAIIISMIEDAIITAIIEFLDDHISCGTATINNNGDSRFLTKALHEVKAYIRSMGLTISK